ncbi:hypothetical protein HK405_011970 [Cladochytrium tenue]|nr:hypothetical protein HK405_011970 [Cladochytrium tenue]
MSTPTIVFITGANSGIGFDTAARLATSTARPYHVVLGVRSLDAGNKAVATIRARGAAGPLTVVRIDVTDAASVRSAADEIAAAVPRLDVLVNNAGIFSRDPDLMQNLLQCLATNAAGPAVVSDTFAPLLRRSADPRIIYVSTAMGSITAAAVADDAMLFGLPYRMSKAALNMLAAFHHRQFASWGCKVWALCPGYVVTNLGDPAEAAARGAGSSETSAATIEDVILGKRDGDVGKFIHKDGVYPW